MFCSLEGIEVNGTLAQCHIHHDLACRQRVTVGLQGESWLSRVSVSWSLKEETQVKCPDKDKSWCDLLTKLCITGGKERGAERGFRSWNAVALPINIHGTINSWSPINYASNFPPFPWKETWKMNGRKKRVKISSPLHYFKILHQVSRNDLMRKPYISRLSLNDMMIHEQSLASFST